MIYKFKSYIGYWIEKHWNLKTSKKCIVCTTYSVKKIYILCNVYAGTHLFKITTHFIMYIYICTCTHVVSLTHVYVYICIPRIPKFVSSFSRITWNNTKSLAYQSLMPLSVAKRMGNKNRSMKTCCERLDLLIYPNTQKEPMDIMGMEWRMFELDCKNIFRSDLRKIGTTQMAGFSRVWDKCQRLARINHGSIKTSSLCLDSTIDWRSHQLCWSTWLWRGMSSDVITMECSGWLTQPTQAFQINTNHVSNPCSHHSSKWVSLIDGYIWELHRADKTNECSYWLPNEEITKSVDLCHRYIP